MKNTLFEGVVICMMIAGFVCASWYITVSMYHYLTDVVAPALGLLGGRNLVY